MPLTVLLCSTAVLQGDGSTTALEQAASPLAEVPPPQQAAVWAEVLVLEQQSGDWTVPAATSAELWALLRKSHQELQLCLFDVNAAEAVYTNHPDASQQMIAALLAAGVAPDNVGKTMAHMAHLCLRSPLPAVG